MSITSIVIFMLIAWAIGVATGFFLREALFVHRRARAIKRGEYDVVTVAHNQIGVMVPGDVLTITGLGGRKKPKVSLTR